MHDSFIYVCMNLWIHFFLFSISPKMRVKTREMCILRRGARGNSVSIVSNGYSAFHIQRKTKWRKKAHMRACRKMLQDWVSVLYRGASVHVFIWLDFWSTSKGRQSEIICSVQIYMVSLAKIIDRDVGDVIIINRFSMLIKRCINLGPQLSIFHWFGCVKGMRIKRTLTVFSYALSTIRMQKEKNAQTLIVLWQMVATNLNISVEMSVGLSFSLSLSFSGSLKKREIKIHDSSFMNHFVIEQIEVAVVAKQKKNWQAFAFKISGNPKIYFYLFKSHVCLGSLFIRCHCYLIFFAFFLPPSS